MSDLKEKLRSIFLSGVEQSKEIFNHNYIRCPRGKDNSVIVLTLKQLREIVELFNESEKRANNLEWRLSKDAR